MFDIAAPQQSIQVDICKAVKGNGTGGWEHGVKTGGGRRKGRKQDSQGGGNREK